MLRLPPRSTSTATLFPYTSLFRSEAAPMLPHLGEGREVDLQQHRDDHQPDEDRDRQVYLRDLGRADRVEDRREEMAEGDADNDAEGDPEGQVALEGRQ